MSRIDSQLRHDFINNALRIEIVNKLLTEKLENKEDIEQEMIEDLKQFLQDHLKYLSSF